MLMPPMLFTTRHLTAAAKRRQAPLREPSCFIRNTRKNVAAAAAAAHDYVRPQASNISSHQSTSGRDSSQVMVSAISQTKDCHSSCTLPDQKCHQSAASSDASVISSECASSGPAMLWRLRRTTARPAVNNATNPNAVKTKGTACCQALFVGTTSLELALNKACGFDVSQHARM